MMLEGERLQLKKDTKRLKDGECHKGSVEEAGERLLCMRTVMVPQCSGNLRD